MNRPNCHFFKTGHDVVPPIAVEIDGRVTAAIAPVTSCNSRANGNLTYGKGGFGRVNSFVATLSEYRCL